MEIFSLYLGTKDPDMWESPDQEKKLQVPVGIHVQGSGEFGANNEVVEMENFYDITDFFDYEPSDTNFSVTFRTQLLIVVAIAFQHFKSCHTFLKI
jgi:hypothetical protein